MPLSEHEQRLLEQMERALVSEDPKFASVFRGAVRRPKASGRAGVAVLVSLIGVVGIISAVVWNSPPLGILGFTAVVFGLFILTTHRPESAENSNEQKKNASTQPNRSFLKGLEERWDRRQENQ